jgi:8-oxo-dGTP pyrophosphatase MutT (NUDIX family)
LSASRPPLAATVLLLRDVAGALEVFMVVRHHEIDFAAGAMVFPGGKVDESDRPPHVGDVVSGASDLTDEDVAVRIAAIREAFEESGVLLARRSGATDVVSAAEALELGSRYRVALASGEISLSEVARREGLVLSCELLVPFAHWITPVGMPKRFDTHFFLAVAPNEQLAMHDGSESVDSTWTAPNAALTESDAGRLTIIFPTRMNLQKLARSRTVADALETAGRSRVVTVMPEVDLESGVLRIPADAGYDVTEASLADLLGTPAR